MRYLSGSSRDRRSVFKNTDGMMPTKRAARHRAVTWALLFSLYFLITVAFQWRANAFRSELDDYADEPGRYVTGLLVHDYISAGFPAKRYGTNFRQAGGAAATLLLSQPVIESFSSVVMAEILLTLLLLLASWRNWSVCNS
jgi:hypothetical protein